MPTPTRMISADTKVVGVTTTRLINKHTFSTGPCILFGLTGFNNSAADLYIQVHELGSVDGGEFPKFSVLAFANSDYVYALPAPITLDALTVAASTSLDDYTAAEGTPITLQALMAA